MGNVINYQLKKVNKEPLFCDKKNSGLKII